MTFVSTKTKLFRLLRENTYLKRKSRGLHRSTLLCKKSRDIRPFSHLFYNQRPRTRDRTLLKAFIESGRRNFMYGPAGPDLAKNLRHIFHLEMRAKSFLDIK